jgi:Regulator of chromosome condensation (RCC1) repeat
MSTWIAFGTRSRWEGREIYRRSHLANTVSFRQSASLGVRGFFGQGNSPCSEDHRRSDLTISLDRRATITEGGAIVIKRYARFGTVLLILAAGLTAVTPLPAGAVSSGGVAAGGVLELTVGGTAGVPTDALAVVLNTTVTNPTTAGFVTVFPCGAERPVASNLNYVKDQTIPNLVIAKLGAGGKVCFYSQQATDLIVDVAGFFPAGSGYVAQASPQRAVDTRGKTRVGGTTIQEVAVTGVFGVPPTASGVALNVTIAGAAADGFATVFPCGQQTPTASNVNYAKSQDIPNFVIATPGVGGKVCVFSSASADVIVDVSGYFEQGTGFTATAAPVRFLDSRGTTRIAAGTSRELTVAGDKGIPADARGVAMNVTAVGASADGFMTVYPCGQSTPVASNLNYTKARDIANSVLAKPGTDGKVCFYSDKTVDIIVDIAGYYGSNSTFTPIPNPTRILDTRTVAQLSPSTGQTLSTGGYHTCVVLVFRKVACWGANGFGQLGNGRTTSADAGTFTPSVVTGLSGVAAVSAGGWHTCALRQDATVWCWGQNQDGQLGTGGANTAVPVQVPGLSGVASVSAGHLATCARLLAGGVKCWGRYDGDSRFGIAFPTTPVDVPALAGATQVHVGRQTTCASFTDGGGGCYLIDYSKSPEIEFVRVPGLVGVSFISKECAIVEADSHVQCWGRNYDHGLGDGTTNSSTTPVNAIGMIGARSVSSGDGESCALLEAGTVHCWGVSSGGDVLVPQAVPLPTRVIAADGWCALDAGGTVYCWGTNRFGQLGVPPAPNDFARLFPPTAVVGLEPVLH